MLVSESKGKGSQGQLLQMIPELVSSRGARKKREKSVLPSRGKSLLHSDGKSLLHSEANSTKATFKLTRRSVSRPRR